MRGRLRERGRGAWELRVYLGRDPATRRDRYKTKTFKGGKRAAQEALASFVTEAGAGTSSEDVRQPGGAMVRHRLGVEGLVTEDDPGDSAHHRHKLGPLLPVPLDKLRTSVLDTF